MREIHLGNASLEAKDYYCIAEDSRYGYIPKEKLSLWLYVNVTDQCNASCPFCVAEANKVGTNHVIPEHFFQVLEDIQPCISGISFTGGEPTLNMELLGQLISGTATRIPDTMEIDLVTNGSNLKELSTAPWIDYLTTLHISRHAPDDEANRRLMNFPAPSITELHRFISSLKDPGQVVFNCVMQRGGVENMEDVASFLDMASELGVQNSSFITMFRANAFCEEHYISGGDFPVMDQKLLEHWNQKHPESFFQIWNRQRDHSYCCCCSGDYKSSHGSTRFYFRCPGTVPAPEYCRQLVYTANNTLQDGFGIGRKVLMLPNKNAEVLK